MNNITSGLGITFIILSCLCAENIPLMAALVIAAVICMGLNSQTIQNLKRQRKKARWGGNPNGLSAE